MALFETIGTLRQWETVRRPSLSPTCPSFQSFCGELTDERPLSNEAASGSHSMGIREVQSGRLNH
jgi:hypothetical protein